MPSPGLPTDSFALLSRVRNKPYDVFGCWLTETSLISGNLHRIGDITSCSVLWLNNAFQVWQGRAWAKISREGRASGAPQALPAARCPPQDVESENVNVVKRLFKIQNLNASTIRTVMVADCSRFDSPDLLLDAGDQATPPCRVFDLGCNSEDEAAGPVLRAPGHAKEGLRRALDGMLDGHTQLSERTLETRVAELLAQGHTKPPERSAARNKYLIFTTGCLTYSPHQIGNTGGASTGGPAAPTTLLLRPPQSQEVPIIPLLLSCRPCIPSPGLRGRRCRGVGWVQGVRVPWGNPAGFASHRYQTDPAAPDDHGRARAGGRPGLRCLL